MNIRVIEKWPVTVQKQNIILIKQYKDEVFSRKVKDVILEIPNLEVPKDKNTLK